jgi:hypothetical protein
MRDRRAHIFVSYRRADSAAVVDHLYDRLAARYGKECIFRDVDNIPYGRDFRSHIRTVLGASDIVLAVVGRCWHGGRGSSAGRIMRDDDPVRIEIEVAFEAGALLIPVLVEGAEVPKVASLPPSLHELPVLNAATLASGKDFEHHLGLLFRQLDEALRQRGKSVVRRPDWLRPAASAAALLALMPLLLFAASAWLGLALGAGAVPIAVVILAAAAALTLSLLFVELACSGRMGWPLLKERPFMAGGLLFVLTLPALVWGSARLAEAIPIRDTPHLGRRLPVEFDKARSQLISRGRGDFAAARRIVDAMLEIDPESDTAWYFGGEIQRLENPRLFDSQSCFRGWPPGTSASLDSFEHDLQRYIDYDRASGESARLTDWGTEVCYDSPRGFCPQRTAWVHQLLAHDKFLDAASVGGGERIARLNTARDHVRQALRYNRPEGGAGFTQCMDSSELLSRIEAALTAEPPR